jgi:hypothetical protein
MPATKSRPAPAQEAKTAALANIRALREARDEAEQVVRDHDARVLRAITRLHGQTYAADGLSFAAWSMGSVSRSTPGVGLLATDLEAAAKAADEKRMVALLAERRECEGSIETGAALHAGLATKYGDALGRYHKAQLAHLDAVRAEAYAPVEAARAKLARLEASAAAHVVAAAAEVNNA